MHIQSIHLGIRYPCDLCSHKSSTRGSLKGHKKLKHKSPNSLKCDTCGFQTNKKYPRSELKRHKETFHDNTEMFPCDHCDYKGISKGLLGRHTKSHTLVKCKYCDFSDTLKTNVRYHILSIHKNLEYPCDDCELMMPSFKLLQEHTHTASG